jgi:MOSC domain-containing protein YiiM
MSTAIEIKAIYLSPGHDFKGRFGQERLEHGIESVASAECLAGLGLRGDRYAGHEAGHKRQITFFDWAVYERMREQFDRPELEPWAFRRNVLVAGLDLNALIGQRFTLQGIEFEGVEESVPCVWMDEAVAPGAFAALKGAGGLRARILSNGTLRLGPA